MENICKSFFKWDEVITKKMSVCSDAKAPLGTFRPFLKLLEYTGHGVPWLSIVGGWILISHQEKHQEILVNLLFGRCIMKLKNNFSLLKLFKIDFDSVKTFQFERPDFHI